MNEIIRNLTIENFLNLKSAFNNSKKVFWDEGKQKLIHPGEYGSYREELIKRWLRMYVPKKFEISSGFIINSENSISTQCDIIIFDKDNTPQIESFEKQKFFPIENVVAVGEVKSDINSIADINSHLEKMAKVKKLRDEIKYPRTYFHPLPGVYSPSINPYDNLFSFLICNKFNFNTSQNFIKYNAEKNHKHNLVLSLEDGLVNYTSKKGDPNLAVPFYGEEEHSETFLRSDGGELPCHINLFLTSFYTALTLTSLLEIDMTYYLTNKIYDKMK
jgi:hypothetical protein